MKDDLGAVTDILVSPHFFSVGVNDTVEGMNSTGLKGDVDTVFLYSSYPPLRGDGTAAAGAPSTRGEFCSDVVHLHGDLLV